MITRSVYSYEVERAISREIAEVKPDLVYVLQFVNKLSPSVLRAAKKMGIPVVLRVSNYFQLCPSFHFLYQGKVCEECLTKGYRACIRKKCIKGSLFASLIRVFSMKMHKCMKIYDDVDAYITPSEFLKNKLSDNGFDKDKINCIPTFTNTQVADEEFILGEYGLYFGRISEEKGIDTIIKAYEKLPDSKVLIVGEDTSEVAAKLKHYVDSHHLTNIEFVGFKHGSELEEIIKNARFTLIPSIWYENLPNTTLESFRYSKPVIASAIGSMPEPIIDGYNGYLFEPGNVEELVKCIQKLKCDSTVRELGKHSRIKLLEEFSSEGHYNKLMKVFDSCKEKANI